MRQWHSKALLALAAVLISLALVEGGLRLLGISYPNFYDYDPQLGLKLRPGVTGYYLKEGGASVTINSDGLRDQEHTLHPPPNTLRIAVLGDSYAEAMQVNREEAFWAVMEKDLSDCATLKGRQVEMINFGQSGFGTTQELLALRHRAWKYSPDVVLLAVCTANDVADNSRDLKQKDKYYDPFHVFQDGRLILDDRRTREKWMEECEQSWRRGFALRLADTFRIVQVWNRGRKVFLEWREQSTPPGQSSADHPVPERGLSAAIYQEPKDDVWKEAWRVTEAVLLLMRDEIARKGAKFFVVVLTNGVQVHPDPAGRAQLAQRLGVQDLFYPDRRVEQFCMQQGIPVLLLAPPFQEYAAAHHVYLHGFKGSLGSGHWNQQGHRLAGQMIARWLCPQLN
jgi:hypothetical protein